MDYNEDPPTFCKSCDEWRRRAGELEDMLASSRNSVTILEARVKELDELRAASGEQWGQWQKRADELAAQVKDLERQRDEANRLLIDAHVRNAADQDEHSAERAAMAKVVKTAVEWAGDESETFAVAQALVKAVGELLEKCPEWGKAHGR